MTSAKILGGGGAILNVGNIQFVRVGGGGKSTPGPRK